MKISSLLKTKKYTELIVKYCDNDYTPVGEDVIFGKYFYKNDKLVPINSPAFNIDTPALKFAEDGVTLTAYIEPVFYTADELKQCIRNLYS